MFVIPLILILIINHIIINNIPLLLFSIDHSIKHSLDIYEWISKSSHGREQWALIWDVQQTAYKSKCQVTRLRPSQVVRLHSDNKQRQASHCYTSSPQHGSWSHNMSTLVIKTHAHLESTRGQKQTESCHMYNMCDLLFYDTPRPGSCLTRYNKMLRQLTQLYPLDPHHLEWCPLFKGTSF